MLFSVAFGVPEKSVFTRLFCVFATDMLANFQDRLVMTASWLIGAADISLHNCIFHCKAWHKPHTNLYSPILPHSYGFVKRAQVKRLPQK